MGSAHSATAVRRRTGGSPSAVQMAGPVAAELCALAIRRLPNECGGLLLGSEIGPRWTIRAWCELQSTQPSPTHYAGDPRALREAIYAQALPGRVVVGMFHTHTCDSSVPSALDSRAAAPGYLHAIVTATSAQPPIRVYRRAEPFGQLNEVPLETGGPASRAGPTEPAAGRP